MNTPEHHIGELLVKHFNQQTNEGEEVIISNWLNLSEGNRLLYERFKDKAFVQQQLELFNSIDKIAGWTRLEKRIDKIADTNTIVIPVRNRPLLRWTAAAAVLAIGSGLYYLNNQSYKSNKSSQIIVQTKAPQTILPGTNKAILTFSNGIQKELSLADNGLQLQSDAVLLTTPNGGQYQAVLPDGSKVWLNAASSIKFPSTFTDKQREVEVTGEVYFEIEKDTKRPFKVYSAGQKIEVLGTSFNINVYDDEPAKKTTLLSGSIKISANNQTAILQPNQQAQIINSSLLIINSSSDVIAWKNGLFNFNNLDFATVMRQLAKWYDIEVKYEGAVPNIKLKGEMDRGMQLTDVLRLLSEIEVKYKIEGRLLIIKS